MLLLVALLACDSETEPKAPPADADTDSDSDADADSDSDADTDSDSDADSDTDTGPLAPDCAAAQAVFDRQCVACHAPPANLGGLDLSRAAAVVGRPSPSAPLLVVDPSGDPDESYLWHKLLGTHVAVGGAGGPMPPAGTLPGAELADVERWLLGGARCEPLDTGLLATGDTSRESDTGHTATVPDGCADVQRVVDLACVSCHGTIALAGLDLRDLSALVGVGTPSSSLPLITAGDADASYLIHKVLGTHADVGGDGVAMPPGAPLATADVDLLTAWIDAGATCALPPDPGEPAPPDPNLLDTETLFTCDGAPTSSPGQIRRIDHHALRRRAGVDANHSLAANPLQPPGSLRYSTYAEGVTLDPTTLGLYLDVVADVGAGWAADPSYERNTWHGRNDTTIRCMYAAGVPTEDCVETWARVYLTTAVTPGEPDPGRLQRFVDHALAVITDEVAAGGDRETSITTITSAAWLHADALFAFELGAGAPDADGRRPLTDLEYASVLAGMLSDRIPGASSIYLYDNNLTDAERYTDGPEGHLADLAAAAADGTLQQPGVAGALFRQHAFGVDDARRDEWIDYGTHSLTRRQDRGEYWMSDKIDRFFLEYFDITDFASTFHDTPHATSRFTGPVWDTSHTRELDSLRNTTDAYKGWIEPDGLMLFTDAVARVVHADQDVLHGLLTTREVRLRATTTGEANRIFDVDTPIDDGARWHTLPADQRAGMLTHPVWLASHGAAFEDGPSAILRGKWVRERLFCETVPPLQLVTVEAQLVASDGTSTARERVAASTETDEACFGCHQYMNSLGYPFELYNHAGYVRADDHGNPPDGSTTLTNAPDPALNRSYADPMELMEALADSPHVKRCFLRHTFRYFAGRDETEADACALAAMEEAYDDSGGSFVAALEALATHESTLHRVDEVSP